MVKERRPLGRSRVRYYRSTSAATHISAADVTSVQLRARRRRAHLTGITAAISHSAREAVIEIARRSRDAGALVSFDLNYRAKLWDRSKLRRHLPADPAADRHRLRRRRRGPHPVSRDPGTRRARRRTRRPRADRGRHQARRERRPHPHRRHRPQPGRDGHHSRRHRRRR